jgi:hypothetical protein
MKRSRAGWSTNSAAEFHEACELGHVHFSIVRCGEKDERDLTTAITAEQARALARVILRAAHDAELKLKNQSEIPGGDAGPCTLH